MSGRGVPPPGRSGEPSRDISQYSSASAFTQASGVSQTSSFRDLIQQAQNLEDELSRSLENQLSISDKSDPILVLKRLLSTRSAISTSSSLATQNQAAIGHDVDFREIGTGSIGQVYEQPGTVFVYKCAILDRSDKIWNNYKMHTRIQEVFDRVVSSKAYDVEIPKCYWYAGAKEAAFWDENLRKFPDTPSERRRREVYCLEHIFPVPKIIREKLIELYCPPKALQAVQADPKNKDCLIRVYLGRRRQGLSSNSRFFTLRNFKLYLDQVEEIGLEKNDLAIAMADALAILHMSARIDGNDVEFVLGSTPSGAQAIRTTINSDTVNKLQPGTSTYQRVLHGDTNFRNRVVRLWMIDFDGCNAIKFDQTGVGQAVTAFMENGHYCPRPNRDDPRDWELWNVFKERYLTTALSFASGFPTSFIDGVVAVYEQRKRRGSAASTPVSGRGRGGGGGGEGGGSGRGSERGGRGGRGGGGRPDSSPTPKPRTGSPRKSPAKGSGRGRGDTRSSNDSNWRN